KAKTELRFVRSITLVSAMLFCVFCLLAVDALWRQGWSTLPHLLMMGGLFYCALAYQLIRLGAAQRRVKEAAPLLPEALLGDAAPSLTVLIPSYQESRRVL